MNELQAFEKHLHENEKSPAAIEKYLCDARAFLLDAEHRQEDHLLRFQAIQVAADGADSAGQSKGNIHRVQATVRASRFTLCSKQRQQETVQRRAVIEIPHHTIGVTGHASFQRENNQHLRRQQLRQLLYQIALCAAMVFGKKAVADSRACPGCGSDSLL